jgi:hypothetical protein
MNTRRLITRAFLIVAALMLVAALVLTSSRRTVVSDTKGAEGVRYGYQLESYRFRNRMFLRFWSSTGLEFSLDLPGYSPRQIDEARWLANDSAIYLRAAVVHRDAGIEKTVPVRILFNFRSGRLLVASSLPLWRVPPGASGSKWLTDDEFDAALNAEART